jgi:hypothetical protein
MSNYPILKAGMVAVWDSPNGYRACYVVFISGESGPPSNLQRVRLRVREPRTWRHLWRAVERDHLAWGLSVIPPAAFKRRAHTATIYPYRVQVNGGKA